MSLDLILVQKVRYRQEITEGFKICTFNLWSARVPFRVPEDGGGKRTRRCPGQGVNPVYCLFSAWITNITGAITGAIAGAVDQGAVSTLFTSTIHGLTLLFRSRIDKK